METIICISLALFITLSFLFIITDYEIMVKNVCLKDVFAWLSFITGVIVFVLLFTIFI